MWTKARYHDLRTSAHVDFCHAGREGAAPPGPRGPGPSRSTVLTGLYDMSQQPCRARADGPAKSLRAQLACRGRRSVENLSTVNHVRTGWVLSLDELAGLVPANNIRHGAGTRGEVVSIGIADLRPEDAATVRALYAMIGALHEIVTPRVDDGLAAVPEIRACAEAYGFAGLVARVSALGAGLDANTVSPLIRKALHDIRGGGPAGADDAPRGAAGRRGRGGRHPSGSSCCAATSGRSSATRSRTSTRSAMPTTSSRGRTPPSC
jgi:hypothetical protein